MKNVSYLLIDCGKTSTDFYGANLSINQSVYCKISNFDIARYNINDLLKYIAIQVELTSLKEIYISYANEEIYQKIISKLKNYKLIVLTREVMYEFCEINSFKIDNIKSLDGDVFSDIVSLDDYSKGGIIIDCGTTSKILAISKNKTFIGSLVYPGMNTFSRIIDRNAPLNDKYNFEKPKSLLSLDNKEALNSGALNGTYFLLKGVIDQIQKTYGLEKAPIYLTGGNAEFLFSCDYWVNDLNFIYDPFLTLKGLAKSFNLNFDSNRTTTCIKVNSLRFLELNDSVNK